MARFKIDLGTEQIKSNVKRFDPKIREYIGRSMEFGADKGMRDMKQNAPWTDDTGNARAGLYTAPSTVLGGNQWEILFSHAVPYGIWLEVRNNGKYQIIMPTVKAIGDELMAHFRDLFREIS